MSIKEVSASQVSESQPGPDEGDQVYGQKVAEMVKKHSSEAFYALEDPLEAAVFSVLVKLLNEGRREE